MIIAGILLAGIPYYQSYKAAFSRKPSKKKLYVLSFEREYEYRTLLVEELCKKCDAKLSSSEFAKFQLNLNIPCHTFSGKSLLGIFVEVGCIGFSMFP